MTNKPGRNDPCPCGSGKKYKQCCWGKETKKTYTSTGKRKFKAKVLSSGGMGGLFPSVTPTTPTANFEERKFKATQKDFQTGESTAVPKPESEETPAPPSQAPSLPPESFESTDEDFRVDEENQN